MATTARTRKRTTAAAERLINRELSFLDYDARLLDLARDETLQLLERVFFLKVFGRDAGRVLHGPDRRADRPDRSRREPRSPDGRTPQQTLDDARERVLEVYASQAALWEDELRPALAEERIVLSERRGSRATAELAGARRPLRARDLPGTDAARSRARPAVSLHLRALDQPRPVRGRPRDRRGCASPGSRCPRACHASSPSGGAAASSRWSRSSPTTCRELFPGMEVLERSLFRVTRDGDLEVADEADDLLEAVELQLLRARFGEVTRLEVVGVDVARRCSSSSKTGCASATSSSIRCTGCSTSPISASSSSSTGPT